MTRPDTSSVTIDLIRHGEPQGGKRFRGHGIDDPLSEKGWQQMWQSVDNHIVAGTSPWQKIISSPMKRCHEFAQSLSDKYSIPCVIEKDLKEVGFGLWEGQTREQVKRSRGEEYKAFYLDPVNQRPQGAEPFFDFVARVAAVYDRIVQAQKGEHVLVVAHAGVIRAVLIHALQEDPVSMYAVKIDNASISRLIHSDHRVTREFINKSNNF